MKKQFVGVMIAGLLCGAGRAEALILIEGFEAGLPAGSVLAPGSVGGTSGAVTNLIPTQGSAFGFIDTRGTTAIPGGTAGSALVLPAFSLADGDLLSLDLNFLTNDGNGFNDFALVLLLDSGSLSPVATLYTANTSGAVSPAVPCAGCPPGDVSAGVALTPPAAFFDGIASGPLDSVRYGPDKFGGGPGGATGWVTSSFTPGAGSYMLVFAVSDVGDTDVNSGLAFDHIRVEEQNPGPVIPEPSSVMLMGLGLGSLPRLRRRARPR